MANIKPYTDQISQAVYGEEVRSSIINALNKVNDDNNSYQSIKEQIIEAKDDVDAQVATFDEKAASAQELYDDLTVATEEAGTAKTALDSTVTTANTVLEQLDSENDDAETNVGALETANATATTTKSQLDQSVSDASDTLSGITQANETAQTNITTLTTTAQAAQTAAQNALDTAETVEADMTQYLADVSAAKQEVITNAQTVAADKADVQALAQTVATNKGAVDTTATQVAANAQTAQTAATSAQSSAASASQSATAASGSATSAATSETNAAASATSAEASATTAGTSATSAANSAAASAQSAADAEFYAERCDSYSKAEIDEKIAEINPLPAGGTVGQHLAKAQNGTQWVTPIDAYTKTEVDALLDDVSGLPEGGTVGQVITKTATGADWQTPTDAYTKAEINTKETAINDAIASANTAIATKITAPATAGTEGQVLTVGNDGVEWTTPIDAYTKAQIDAKETAINTAIGTKITEPTTGSAGQYLAKTATGTEWTTPTDAYTKTETDNLLSAKITAPVTGTTGQYLKKTETGVEWADVEGGGGTLIVQPPVVDVTTYTYDGTEKSITFSSIESNNVDLTGDKATNAGTYTCTVSLNKQNAVWSDTFTTTPKTFTWTINKAAGALTLSKSSVVLDPDHLTDTVTCTVVGDGTLTVTSSDTDVATATLSGNTITIASVDDKSGNITVTVSLSETTNYSAPEDETISVKGDFVSVYGAEWDGTSTTAWTRTDEAASFIDPVPAINNGNGSSPFDDLMPWSGMVIEERTGGTMVKIPKFYYKITRNGNKMKIQIAGGEVDGFEISPAHMDRGDGNGERDAVYIGRYHCGTSYKSITSVKPLANMTRSSARTNIHNLGANYWQMDFATRFTIWLLYIVEFADWNTQAKIGYGCGNNSATENMGYTDSMTYHTGTKLSSRTTYGLGTQYRHIEGIWDNVYDWCDGCYYNSSGLNIILNPSNFNDSSNGTLVGKPSNGYPSAFASNNTAGFTLFYPTTASGSESTYSCDYWGYGSSSPCLCVGGSYSQSAYHGLFYVHYASTSYSDGDFGCRLLELP